MEFTQPNRNTKGRPKLSVPQRGDTISIDSRHRKYPAPVSKKSVKIVGVTIDFGSLPSKKIVLSRARRFLLTKKTIVAGSIIAGSIGTLTTWSLVTQHSISKIPGGTISHETVENLEYQTVLPAGKSVSELGGWKRVSPVKNDPVFAYADKIGEVSISVSQQPLPQSFKTDIDNQVAELAKKFNATTKIDASSTTVYVGTSAKGPQSAIFTKNGLLILIKSQKKINDVAWEKYIKALN